MECILVNGAKKYKLLKAWYSHFMPINALVLAACADESVTYEEVAELGVALREQLKRPETGLIRSTLLLPTALVP
jgi:hypothetical protein